jgi:hypothetical protein
LGQRRQRREPDDQERQYPIHACLRQLPLQHGAVDALAL